MKKLFIALIILLSACATTTKNTVLVNKPTLSVKRFVSTCGMPVESYFVQQLGVRIHRHKNCMDIGDLLSLVWAGDTSQRNVDGVSLLAIMYATHLSNNDPDASYLTSLLKIDSFTQNNLKTHVAFFKIKRKSKI
jgi:hypothetical protein